MTDYSHYQHLGVLAGVDYYGIQTDIILVVPPKGFLDSPIKARQSVEFQDNYARQVGKKCATLVVMSNVLGQDAETRRIYNAQAANGLYYGAALVVDNALSRALASFLIGMTQMQIPLKLFDTVENAIDWLVTLRAAGD